MVKRFSYVNYRNRKKWGEKGCKVFISGPMSGYPDFNRSSFYFAEDMLKQQYGAAVFNPAWMLFDCDYWTHDQILNIDICALNSCDAILHLPGWERSDGAFEEASIAKELHLKELYLDTDDQDRLIIIEHGEHINEIRDRLREKKNKDALKAFTHLTSSDFMINHGTDDEGN